MFLNHYICVKASQQDCHYVKAHTSDHCFSSLLKTHASGKTLVKLECVPLSFLLNSSENLSFWWFSAETYVQFCIWLKFYYLQHNMKFASLKPLFRVSLRKEWLTFWINFEIGCVYLSNKKTDQLHAVLEQYFKLSHFWFNYYHGDILC